MRCTLLVLLVLSGTVSYAHADDKLAAEFLRRHPELKHFDPAAEGLRQEVKEGIIKPAEAKRMLQAARANVQKPVPAFAPARAGGSLGGDPKRTARMARATRRRAAVAADEAAGAAAISQAAAYERAVVRLMTPHF